MNTILKICARCLRELSIDNFGNGNGKYNKKNYCKKCSNEYNKIHYDKNRKTRIKEVSEWNNSNPDKVKQYQKNWTEKSKVGK